MHGRQDNLPQLSESGAPPGPDEAKKEPEPQVILRRRALPTQDRGRLSAKEVARAERVGERLAAELRAFLQQLPAQARRAAGLSRRLGVDRGTAARCVRTTRYEGASAAVDALMHAPGVKGLRQLVEAGRADGLPEEELAALEAAIEAYEALIEEMGGSQSRLNSRLRHAAGTRASARSDREDAARQEKRQRRILYETARGIVGRSSDVRTEVVLTSPDPDRPGALQRFWARGLIGYQSSPDAMPLVIGAAEHAVNDADPQQGASDEVAALPSQIRGVVAEGFSSSPPPVVTRRGPDNRAIQAIDPAAVSDRDGADVVLMSDHPDRVVDTTGDPVVRDEIRTLVRNPTAFLLFDVYIHASLAGDRLPGVGLYLWSPAFQQQVTDFWFDRLPHPPVLHLLGRGLSNAHSDAYPRQADLAAACFARAGWDPTEFVGFRFAVKHPVWGGCYCLSFRYQADDEP